MITEDKLNEALELIAKGLTRPTYISKAMGIAYRTYCSWMVLSNRGDERFLVIYNGEVMQWAKAITLATKIALFELRGMVLMESIYGYDEIQTKDGQVVWQIDPVAAALPEEDREWMGYRKDALLEFNGALQPVTLKRKAPFAQQIRLLEAAFPDLRPSQTINQNVNLNGQVGIGFAKPIDYSKGPPAVPPPPPRPELPAPVDAEFNEVDDDLAEMLGPEPVLAPININIVVPEHEPEPEPEVTAPRPPVDTPPPGPMTPLQRDLWDRVQASKEKAAAAAAAKAQQP